MQHRAQLPAYLRPTSGRRRARRSVQKTTGATSHVIQTSARSTGHARPVAAQGPADSCDRGGAGGRLRPVPRRRPRVLAAAPGLRCGGVRVRGQAPRAAARTRGCAAAARDSTAAAARTGSAVADGNDDSSPQRGLRWFRVLGCAGRNEV